MRRLSRVTLALALIAVVALVAAACSSDDSTDPETPDDATETEPDDTDGDEPEPDDTDGDDTEPDDTEPVPEIDPVRTPAEVDGPVTAGAGPVLPQPAAPAPEGYVTEEFFIGGEATSFTAVGDQDADGFWTVAADATAPYRTRILVRRPPAEQFSGVVVVEWLNVSAVEASPDWGYVAEEVGREGHAYVALSAQAQGVVGGETLLQVEIDADAAAELGAEDGGEDDSSGLVNIDPERYGTLEHPGDAYSFDILSQLGALLATGSDTVLGGLEATTVIAAGESQSAGFLTTYVNAIHPNAGVFDGFLVHSRGAGAAPLDGIRIAAEDDASEDDASEDDASEDDAADGEGSDGEVSDGEVSDGEALVSDGIRVRTDLTEPVLILEAETDLTLLGYAAARQPDTDTVRTWEVAGTAHSDAHVFRAMLGGGRDPSMGSLLGCTSPINAGPHHEAVQAGLHHLVGWAQGGPPPPAGTLLELVEDDDGAVAIARDEIGMALGGVRNPLVDVPVAVYSGDPPGDASLDSIEDFNICSLFGQTIPLDQATLLELHGSADDYVASFRASTADSVDAGFLLPADGEQLIEEAEANRALFTEA